jgi:hypothetical protein
MFGTESGGIRATLPLIAAYRDQARGYQARRSRPRGLVAVVGPKGPVVTDLGPWMFPDGVRAQRPGNARIQALGHAARGGGVRLGEPRARRSRPLGISRPVSLTWKPGREAASEPAALRRCASVPDLSERRKRARKRDRGLLPPRNAGCEEGRPPQWEVGTAGGSSRGLLSPVTMGDTRSGSSGAGS